jgi:hypothetical protein
MVVPVQSPQLVRRLGRLPDPRAVECATITYVQLKAGTMPGGANCGSFGFPLKLLSLL